MSKKQEFIKKNKFFVSLLSVLLLINVALFTYIGTQRIMETGKTPYEVPEEEIPTQETTEITEFIGNYNRSSDQILFHWSYRVGKAGVRSVHLYHGENELLNVSSYSSYDLPREGYGISTGDNAFTLVIKQENDKEIRKTINVFVKYVVNPVQSVKHETGRTKVTLEYRYRKDHPVKVPKLIMLDDSINYTRKDYIETTYKEDGDMVTAKTTYEFLWYESPVEYQQFSIRWAFEDINDSIDFTLEKGKAPEQTDTTQ